jgi:hypothetical protein
MENFEKGGWTRSQHLKSEDFVSILARLKRASQDVKKSRCCAIVQLSSRLNSIFKYTANTNNVLDAERSLIMLLLLEKEPTSREKT